MVAWFMIAIGTIAFFAFIAVSGVNTVAATGAGNSLGETMRRIDAVASMLQARSSSFQGDGIVYAPAGVADSSGYLLPAEMQQIGITSFGSRFLYCPMGTPLDTANATVTYSGGSYGIRTAALNGRSYVVTGRVPGTAGGDPAIMGFVLAQAGPDQAMPGCAQISRSGETYTAPNGIVRPLRRNAVGDQDMLRTSEGTTYYVTTNGTGDGRSWSSPSSLSNALSAYRSSNGGSFMIRLGTGNYNIDGSPLDQTVAAMATKKEDSSLMIQGNGNTVYLGSRIYTPGNLELQNVDMRGTAVLIDAQHSLRVITSTVGPLVARGNSQILLSNATVIPTANYTATINALEGSSVAMTNAVNVQVMRDYVAYYGEAESILTMYNGTMTIQPFDQATTANGVTRAFALDANSRLNMKYVTVNFNLPIVSWGILTAGEVTSFNTTLNFNASTWVGIQTQPGAALHLYEIVMRGTSPAQYPLATQSASVVNGNGSIYSQTRCWYQGENSLLRMANPGTTGNTSQTTADEAMPAMSAMPTPAQVQAYQAAAMRNVQRENMRIRVSGAAGYFTCMQSG